MPYLSLTLLGTFQITLDGKPATAFESDKVRALLAYLAVEAAQPHRREALAELFWPERPEGVARDNLRQALSNLRTAIGDRKATPPFLWITHEEVQFNPHSAHWLDVAALAGLLSACQNHPHRRVETCRPCIRRLRQAVALYGGDFLAQFFLRDSPAFEEWTLVKREWLQRQALTALKHLATYHERRGEYEEACSFARRQVNLEPWDEEAQRGLMRLLALNGQRSAALAQYRTCCRLLADELGLEPAAETTALYEQIRMGEYPTGQSVASPWDRWANGRTPYLLVSPAPPPPTSLHNLPPQPTPFIGREVELIEIEERLEEPACRLLTLVGAGGIGKTRLAWQVAFENIGGYNHGVYFVPLVGLSSPEYLVSAIANAIQFTFSSEGDPKAQLLNYLRQAKREMLLVLDNFEHLLIEGPLQGAGVGLLVEILTVAPELKLLVTSRERLRLQEEWTYNVPGMRYPQDDRENGALEVYSAVQLFMACAQRAQADFALRSSDGPDLLRICRTVEGMPLGLELAAAWVRTLTITEIADEIEGSLDLLATSLQNVPERHRSLRAVFERSWKLLTAAEQGVFKRMSVFQRSFPRAAAEWVTGASLTILSSLVDKSLLKHTRAGQYEIHELLRQFCKEKLGEDAGEEAQARESHCRYYGNFLKEREADLKGGREKEALAEIEGEIDNVRAGWYWAVAQGDEGAIENYLKSLALFYEIRSWHQEGREAFGRAVAALRRTKLEGEKGRLLGKVLAEQGKIYNLLGLYEQARELVEESLVICRQLGSQPEIAYVYRVLGDIAIHRGALADAKPLYQESLALYKAIGDQDGIMISLGQLGWGALKRGEIEQAAVYLQESLALLRAKGLRRKMVWALMDLGGLALGLGRYHEASQYCQESVAISRELGYQYGLAFSLSELGWIVRDLGAYQEAKQYFQESLAVYQTLGHQRGIGWILSMLGYIAILLGELTEAEAYLRESHTYCQALGDEEETWWCRCVQGELALTPGAYAQAEEHFQQSMVLFKDISDIGVSWGVAWSLNGLGRTVCALEAYQKSKEYFQKALKSAVSVPSIPEALDVLVGMATLLAASGKEEEAVELLAIPLHHLASRQITKDRAARLLAKLEAKLPPEVVAMALEEGGRAGFEQIVAAVLDEKSPPQ